MQRRSVWSLHRASAQRLRLLQHRRRRPLLVVGQECHLRRMRLTSTRRFARTLSLIVRSMAAVDGIVTTNACRLRG